MQSSPEHIALEAKREEEAKAGGRAKMLESMARQEVDETEYEQYRSVNNTILSIIQPFKDGQALHIVS